MKLKTYQLGNRRKRGEGLRIGTVRFLPRGVKKEDYAKFDYFDVWLPSLAPSRNLIAKFRDNNNWGAFVRGFIREMNGPTARQTIMLLARIAEKTPISIGCYCGNEKECHCSILRKLIIDAANNK